MKNAVVIGASSGIGRELALLLARNNFRVCATARRVDLLEKLLPELSEDSLIRKMDLANSNATQETFADIANSFGNIDLVIISAGIGFLNPALDWQQELETIQTNVAGFTVIADLACQQFIRQKYGHLVAISSLAALRGGGTAPAYNASKAYVSNYIQGLRQKCAKISTDIYMTDARPGFVDTDMAKGEGLFWVQSVEKVSKQIYRALEKKRKVVYVTRRWRLIAWLVKILPDAIYNKM